MSEPKSFARHLETLLPGLLHWTVADERINYRSDAYAVLSDEGAVLIDPLPLDEGLVERMGRVAAICLTGGFHQRSAWRLRERLGVPVWAPAGARHLEGEPDERYEADELLPGGLRAIHAPGPTHLHFVFLWEEPRVGAVLFSGDLLIRRDEDAPLVFVPGNLQDNPERTRESVRQLVEIRPSVLCPAHGPPLLERCDEALLMALARES